MSLPIVKVSTSIKSTIQDVWDVFTKPEHIVNWNFATEEWHCPTAKNEVHVGGTFTWRMEAKDGSMGFDYSGTYDDIIKHESIELHLDDNRKVWITFRKENDLIHVVESFEIEDENIAEMQKQGWKSILTNMKNYAESL